MKPQEHNPALRRVNPQTGFSLIELLVVVAILGLVATFVVSGLGAATAYRVTTAGAQLKATVELARQSAATTGETAELRFYKSVGGSNYSAFRIMKRKAGEETFLKPQRMPEGMVFKTGIPASTLLELAGEVTETNPPAGCEGTGVKVIRFLPNGSMDGLSGVTNAVWVSIAREAEPASNNGLPPNFATLSIDTLLGTTVLYRP